MRQYARFILEGHGNGAIEGLLLLTAVVLLGDRRMERRSLMATESIGRTVYLNDDSFEQIVNAMERMDANPPKPRESTITWGDPQATMRDLERKYSGDKRP
jgi:hypothetical protein